MRVPRGKWLPREEPLGMAGSTCPPGDFANLCAAWTCSAWLHKFVWRKALAEKTAANGGVTAANPDGGAAVAIARYARRASVAGGRGSADAMANQESRAKGKRSRVSGCLEDAQIGMATSECFRAKGHLGIGGVSIEFLNIGRGHGTPPPGSFIKDVIRWRLRHAIAQGCVGKEVSGKNGRKRGCNGGKSGWRCGCGDFKMRTATAGKTLDLPPWTASRPAGGRAGQP
jgi:hypothetical protein